VFEQLGFHQGTATLAQIGAGCQARVMLTVYVYQKCSTCRDALQWLDARGTPYQVKAIRETPPTPAELAVALKAFGGEMRKIFNTSGIDYRALGLKDRLPAMSESDALDLLSKKGNLVKRPFLIGEGKVLVGFKQADWEKALPTD
jgi:arsenate reductase